MNLPRGLCLVTGYLYASVSFLLNNTHKVRHYCLMEVALHVWEFENKTVSSIHTSEE